MADMRFAVIIQRERERLHKEREAHFNQQHELENKLAEINESLLRSMHTKPQKLGRLSRLPVNHAVPGGNRRIGVVGGKLYSNSSRTIRAALSEAKSSN